MPPAAFKMKHLVCSQQIHPQLHSASRPVVCNPCKPSPSSQAPWSAASTGSPPHLLSLTLSLGLPQSMSTAPGSNLRYHLHTPALQRAAEAFVHPEQALLKGRLSRSRYLFCAWFRFELWASSSWSALLGPAALASPHYLLHMQIFRSHPGSLNRKLHTGGAQQSVVNQPSRRPYCRLKPEKCCSPQMAPPHFAMCFSLPESLWNYTPKMKS